MSIFKAAVLVSALFPVALFSISAMAQGALPSEERIAQLKSEIRKIANERMMDTPAEFAQTRAALDPLVNELRTAYNVPLAKDQLTSLAGSWRQLWSDDSDGDNDFAKSDRGSVFQVVSDKGWFYNVSDVISPLTRPLGFLRGEYTPNGERFDIQFTKVSVRLSKLGLTENVPALVNNVEAGTTWTIVAPGGGRYPNGPVGVKGYFTNIYIDDDFRIVTGRNETYNTDLLRMYILDKADALSN
jgi:hypothetical protein